MFHCSSSLLKGLLSRRKWSRVPAGLTIFKGLQIALYTHLHVRQAVPLVTDPGSKLLTTPRPRIVGILTRCRVCARAQLYTDAQDVVIGLLGLAF
jgi:hypothetical protein